MLATTSARGRKLIEKWEGLYLKAYQDSVGVWTIGYGSITNHQLGIAVYPGLKIDEATADKWLEVEMAEKEAVLRRLVKVPLTQNQFDALSSWVYNLGEGNLKKSTLLRLLNAGKHDRVPAEMLKYTHAGGKFVQGLANRRRDEVKMWNGEKIASVPDTPIIRVNPTIIGMDPATLPAPIKQVLTSPMAKTVVTTVVAGGTTVMNQVTLPVVIATVVGMALGAYITYSIDHKG